MTGPNILQEARRNLVGKLGMNPGRVDRLLNNIASVSAVKVPKGRVHIAGYAPDDLVLEVALMGLCDVLVTGDKKHLLPLQEYRAVTIEPPSVFLKRFEI